jgi:peptidoglycan/xylan/chitin deacetylase (PgdA/CDA1 family)
MLQDREVVLIFDDGPWAVTTPKVLAALARECVLATFFLIGKLPDRQAGLGAPGAGAQDCKPWPHRRALHLVASRRCMDATAQNSK